MDIVEYKDHDNLISFYSSRGIEELEKFENPVVFSYIIKENSNLIAAVTCTRIDDTFIIETIAVGEAYERQNIGTKLLGFALDKLASMNADNIILNTKNPVFFEKNGFTIINNDEVPVGAYSFCFECPDYQVNCFPKVMKYVGKNKR